jgi:hypothetical protein
MEDYVAVYKVWQRFRLALYVLSDIDKREHGYCHLDRGEINPTLKSPFSERKLHACDR